MWQQFIIRPCRDPCFCFLWVNCCVKWRMFGLESWVKKYKSNPMIPGDLVVAASLLSLIRISVGLAVYLIYLVIKRVTGHHKPSKVTPTFAFFQIHSCLTASQTHPTQQQREDVLLVRGLVTKIEALLALTQFLPDWRPMRCSPAHKGQ